MGIFVLAVLLGLWLAYSYWARQKAEEEREDAVWMARIELKVLQSDKSIAYLRLKEMKYEDNLLKLYFTSWPTSYDDNPQELMNDFTSLLTMNPDMWRKVSDYLQQAAVNLQINCSAGLPIMIGNAQLDSLLDNEKLMERGRQVFVEKKKQEVLKYAQTHFRGDPYFRVEEVKSDDRFVTLRLSYDDSNSYLGKTYTDTARVNAHFTDAVGDMGSILDGMLTICTRTNTGFAFEYTGRKKHTRTRLEWSADKARELQKNIAERYWHRERKTNQVRTVMVREQRAK
ncbi:MAG: hypothetical protein IJ841_06130 [Prevotella sp.]|nr:hypothetical protein [Prevotella sp.]